MSTSRKEPTGLSIPISVAETDGIARAAEPVSAGIPLPREAVFGVGDLALVDADGSAIPAQFQVSARWPDGSIKWILVEFKATVETGRTAVFELRRAAAMTQTRSIVVKENAESIEVDTGGACFYLDKRVHKPFSRVVVEGLDVLDAGGCTALLIDAEGRKYEPRIARSTLETAGTLRTTLRFEGRMEADGAEPLADFVSRVSFFAGSPAAEIKLTLRNSRAASHPGGLWDLGDAGSVYFRDFSVALALGKTRTPRATWSAEPGAATRQARHLEIYQDSSGGENWLSSNHVDKDGAVGCSFRGYRTIADGQTTEGLRAAPTVSLSAESTGVTAAIEGFWQNFPKCIEVDGRTITLRLFPRQFRGGFELQPGEQKTHTVYFSFDTTASVSKLEWVHRRLRVSVPPQAYMASRAVAYLSPREPDSGLSHAVDLMERLVDNAVSGERTFFDRREIIDEYGWRNFGDLYADHEAVGHQGAAPLVAHYNNQYDVIYGALVQYLRGSGGRWFELASDLARHVVDVDIYHTAADRRVFNGGMFWHTQHYTDAATATHRAYSKAAAAGLGRHQSGGGPSSEHNYTSGLLLYHYLTGDPAARETVIGLADWVLNMDQRGGGALGLVDRRPRGLCSITVSWDYHGPGRGAANSINALLDAFALTGLEEYRRKAEELIRRSIHPRDDIEARNLGDIEHRWSYTVFLQMLGKYLDFKAERSEIDRMYGYARASLLHYARWMLEQEAPYRTMLDRVEIPTETWPAQDIRKSNVFRIAARCAEEPLRSALIERGKFFFERSIGDLLEFETCTLTRPIVLMMTNGYVQSYFAAREPEPAPQVLEAYDFDTPRTFKPQFYELYRARERVYRARAAISDALRQLRSPRSHKESGAVGERA
jgi:hypothetical protein